ncbi:PREDICTED: UNC93-like protein 3 isoform X3 [Nelumbo nucifera]|uniref:UNC93-like protein 3 isoform X3 n=1 Tax=Nelumbo nucifera TaxID=4432 RepID=A0A1U8Q1X0_NELNU|nr:PREDICTED: UNC93-like protein 3 isoform X3 [Nelumbo nucifera]
MDSVVSQPEDAPLVEGDSSYEAPKSHARDVHILSSAFLLVFLAYGAAQNLESTVNTEENIGTTSLGILYLSFTIFSLVSSPVVRILGSKNALVLGTTGYWLFVAANLKPSWYTMVPASIYLGFAASIIWVGQFIGNLITLALLGDGKEGATSGTTLLFIVFLGSMTLGTMLMCFLRKTDNKAEEGPPKSYTNLYSFVVSLLKLVIAPLFDIRMLLIIPLIAYSGLQQAFVWAEFTKYIVTPALGVSGVGGAMAVYGAFDALCSLAAGKFTSGLSSITIIVPGGALIQVIVLLWLFLKYSRLTSGLIGSLYPLLMAAMLGIGNGIFNTQLNALLGILFRHDMEGAFAQLKVWQSASIAVVFFLSPHITLKAMLVLMLIALCVSVCGFLFLTLWVERTFSSGSG